MYGFYHTLRCLFALLLVAVCGSSRLCAQTVAEWRRTEQHPVHAENHHYQDSEGYMWYGTLDGLCRDDGYTVELITSRTHPAFANNYVLRITEDRNHRLWIGTMNGVYILDKRDYTIAALTDDKTTNRLVTLLFTAADGSVYVGVKGWLCCYSPDGALVATYDLGSDGRKVECMIEDAQGDFLLGMDVLCRLNVSTGEIQPLPNSCHNPVSIIRDAAEDCYWIATAGDGLVRYDPAAPKESEFSTRAIPRNGDGTASPHLLSVVQDNVTRRLWTTSMNNLFCFHVQDDGTLLQTDVPAGLGKGNKLLYKMLKDRQGDIWVSALDRKSFILTFQQDNIRKYALPNPLEAMGCNPMVSSLCIEHGVVWYGLERFGLYMYDGQTRQTVHFSDCPAARRHNLGFVKKIIPSRSEGQVWVMVDQSRKVFGARRTGALISDVEVIDLKQTDAHAGEVQTVFEDKDGHLWIGTTAQLYVCRHNDRMRPEKVLDAPSFISGIVQTSDGVVWATCRNKGVYRIGDETTFLPSAYDFTCMAAAPDNSLWLGTGQGGLLYCDSEEEGKFVSYAGICGSDENAIGSLRVDSYGYVWIVTNRTLQILNPETNMVRTYTVADYGIDMERFFPLATSVDSTGSFCIGGAQGVVCVDPVSLIGVENSAKVNVTSVKVEGETVFIGMPAELDDNSSLSLAADSRNISISFSSLDYLNTSAVRYAYRMSGVDEDWNYTQPGQNQAFYNSLPKGERVFEVKATNKDGIWSRNVTRMTVCRQPYWYETFWAQTLYVLASLCLLLAVMHIIYKRSKRQHEQKLENQMEVYKSVLLPDESGTFRLPSEHVSEKDSAFLDSFTRLIEENMGDSEFKVENMAAMMAMSRSAFFKRVKDCVGFPPKEYLRILRLNKASELLADSNVSIADVAYKVGFDDALYFSKCFKSRFGISPTVWQKEHSS